MPQTALTVTQLNAFDGAAAAGEFAITETAADTSNGNKFTLTSREILIARNSGASARTITVTSLPDAINGRSGDITTYSIPAGASAAVPPLKADGWKQADGSLYIAGSHAEVLFSVLRLPANLPL